MKAISQSGVGFYATIFGLGLFALGCRTIEREETRGASKRLPSLPVKPEETLTAQVIRLKGAARFSLGGDKWQPVTNGTRFGPDCLMQTASDSRVDVCLVARDKPLRPYRIVAGPHHVNCGDVMNLKSTVIRIQSDSVVRFERLATFGKSRRWEQDVKDIRLDLRGGKLLVSSQRMMAGSTFEIRTTDGVVRIAGKEQGFPESVFDFSADGVVQVLCGSVAFAPATANVGLEIHPCERFDARTREVTKYDSLYDYHTWVHPIPIPMPLPDRWPSRPDRKF